MRFVNDHYQDKKNYPDPPSPYDKNDPKQKPLRRSEDGIIAFTWWKYMVEEGGNDEYADWLLRFPMTKGVVRAMDAATDFISNHRELVDSNRNHKIENWIVSGASKRGWTTWTVGATDPRVVAIAPLVEDLGRLNSQMHSHFQDLGGWTFAFEDYYFENITKMVDTYEFGQMCKHIDPWSYRYKYRDRNILVYPVNTMDDEFFLADDNVQYMEQIKTEGIRDNQIWQRYLRNAEHSMAIHALTNQHIIWSMEDLVLLALTPQYKKPAVYFKNTEVDYRDIRGRKGKRGIIRLESDTKPEAVNMYFARTQSRKRRDFRIVYSGCLARNETTGNRSDHVDCDCPEVTRGAEERGEDIKGICQELIVLWTAHRDSVIFDQTTNTGLKQITRESDKYKYQYAWEGEFIVFDDDDFFRGAYLEFKFPGLYRETLIEGEHDFELPDVFNNKRGHGLSVNSQALIVPLEKPNPDCTKESCFGYFR